MDNWLLLKKGDNFQFAASFNYPELFLVLKETKKKKKKEIHKLKKILNEKGKTG